MFNVRDIIRNNNATFYDFNTRKGRSQTLRVIVTCAAAVFAAIFCPKVSDNLLAGFLAVQSILLGFSVNVMFYLLGNREDDAPEKNQSLEAQLRSNRLRKLYRELFYNVSYFNLIAVVSIIVAATLLLPTPEVPRFSQNWSFVVSYVQWLDTSTIPTMVTAVLRFVAMFVFYAMAIEVIFSIARVIGRTTFYFERKMGEVGGPDDEE